MFPSSPSLFASSFNFSGALCNTSTRFDVVVISSLVCLVNLFIICFLSANELSFVFSIFSPSLTFSKLESLIDFALCLVLFLSSVLASCSLFDVKFVFTCSAVILYSPFSNLTCTSITIGSFNNWYPVGACFSVITYLCVASSLTAIFSIRISPFSLVVKLS